LKEINPIDLADGWEYFDQQQRLILFKLLDHHRAVEVFEQLKFEDQYYLMGNLEPGSLGPVITDLPPEDVTKFFHRLPDKIVKKLLTLMKKEDIEQVQKHMSYKEGSAGRIMHADFPKLKPDFTARQALDHIQASVHSKQGEQIHSFFVTNQSDQLLGKLSLNQLIAAPRDMRLYDLMTPVQLLKVNGNQDQEEVAHLFTKYDLIDAPVVDNDNRLIGVVTIDDVVDVINQEATEDIAKMAGTEAEELTTRSVVNVVKARMPWLMASWVGGIIASILIGKFEHILGQIVALAAFLPVIMGMGGNVGSQSSTIVVRGLATGYIKVNELAKVFFKEVRVALILGIGYGILLAVAAFVLYGMQLSFQFPLVVGLGIIFSITFASTLGAMLPMLFKRIGIDPAVATGPFVSTITDIMSIVIYFSMAGILLL
ncbi:MAG: magnesium transporter, partial [Elusimicrobia bacterium]|nr:magnesium transporter [Elusimicrobiota bacterium]MBD3412713.1 magnesium transporter [Elusimicrobiota bacterium]